jgi:hypothetical protein
MGVTVTGVIPGTKLTSTFLLGNYEKYTFMHVKTLRQHRFHQHIRDHCEILYSSEHE